MNKSIYEILTAKMIDLPITYTWRGHDSAIFIEFGKLTKDIKKNHPQGEFSLMLDCDWRVERPRSILLGSFCGQKRIDNQLKKLIGNSVTKIETLGYLPEIVISLSSNLRIASFTSYEGQPEWALFLPDKSWLQCKLGKIIQAKAEQRH